MKKLKTHKRLTGYWYNEAPCRVGSPPDHSGAGSCITRANWRDVTCKLCLKLKGKRNI